MVAANAKQTNKIQNNKNKGFISDQYKDPNLGAQTIQRRR